MMRTTLNLPEDVYSAARSLASMRNVSLGDALAELVRRGLRPGAGIRREGAFPCFDIPEDVEAIPLERTLEIEDEL